MRPRAIVAGILDTLESCVTGRRAEPTSPGFKPVLSPNDDHRAQQHKTAASQMLTIRLHIPHNRL